MMRVIIGLTAALVLLRASAEELEWLTDVPKAVAKAKAEKKIVLLDFTGSDWCASCIKLHKEVFSTPEFAQYAKTNLVLVELDYPIKKEQSEELRKANEALAVKYEVEGLPRIIALDGEGKNISDNHYFGYEEGGPKVWIAEFENHIKRK
jgi:thioredoxin-related protein